jgi:hypothetical protein
LIVSNPRSSSLDLQWIVILVGWFGGITILLTIVIFIRWLISEASLDSNASSIIRSNENFKVVGFGAAIVVCIMSTRSTSI